ncbi:MAG: hypothetical protein ACR2F6_16265 [Mycobacteriales bacterium]
MSAPPEGIEAVREGMDVIDPSGDKIGTVALVQVADPDAVTADPQPDLPADDTGADPSFPAAVPPVMPGSVAGGPAGLGVGALGGAPGGAGGAGFEAPLGGSARGDEPHLPPPLAERLRRTGYLKIDSKGIFRADRYASAEDIDSVTDVVHLRAVRDDLLAER